MSGLVLASTVSSTAGAFKEHWHKAITQSALSFLQQPILASMLKVHDQLDAPLHFWTAGVDHWHFNDCNFEGSTKHINKPALAELLDVSVGTISRWETGAEPISRQTQLAVLLLLEHTLATGMPTPSAPSNDTSALRRIA